MLAESQAAKTRSQNDYVRTFVCGHQPHCLFLVHQMQPSFFQETAQRFKHRAKFSIARRWYLFSPQWGEGKGEG
jgi:hypothetical protein